MHPPGVPRPRLRVGLSKKSSNKPLTSNVPRKLLKSTNLESSKAVTKTASQSTKNSSCQIEYFSVLYTKRSKKKHKSWLDGYIILRQDRAVELQNEDGKKIAATRFSTALGGLKEGNTLEIGSFELEVQNYVAEDEYLSGRLFLKTTPSSGLSSALHNHSSVRKQRAPFKPLRPKKQATSELKHTGPLHDPNSPNACILLPKSAIARGEFTVPVVLDPYLSRKMRPHQKEGVKFLYNCVQGNYYLTREGGQGAILADEMGLGKSLQAIALVWTLLKQSPKGQPLVKKAIIVCPASLVQNWLNEVNKWLGFERLRPVAIESGNSSFEAKQAMASFITGSIRKLLIVSYEMFRSYSEELYKANCGLIICDEGHRLKSSQGNKTIEALKKLPCRKRVILTGTPVQNDLEEFFAVCDFVNPACLNSLSSFRSVFAGPILASRDSNASLSILQLGKARAQELSRITSSFVLRRTSDILTRYLPPKLETVIFCRLQPRQEKEYMVEAESKYFDIANNSRFSAALSAINYLRKICSHPILVSCESQKQSAVGHGNTPSGNEKNEELDISDSTKMQITISLCQEAISVSDRIVVVSNFTSTLDLIQKALQQVKVKYCRLDGTTSVNLRADIVRQFNNGTAGDIFLLSAKAGGVGLNLIGANRLILFDPDWNPATDLQAMGRVWRDGQKKHVFVYRLLCTGTIEEKIYQRQLFKGELQTALEQQQTDDTILGDNHENFVGRRQVSKNGNFSTEELRDLFQYKADIRYCDTLQVLERSQLGSNSVTKDIPDSLSLLKKFGAYKRLEEDADTNSIVHCADDLVLDRTLNARLDTHGLVSYMYTKSLSSSHSADPVASHVTRLPTKRTANEVSCDDINCLPDGISKKKIPKVVEDTDEESSVDSDTMKLLLERNKRKTDQRIQYTPSNLKQETIDNFKSESTSPEQATDKCVSTDETPSTSEIKCTSAAPINDEIDMSSRWEEAVNNLAEEDFNSL